MAAVINAVIKLVLWSFLKNNYKHVPHNVPNLVTVVLLRDKSSDSY